MNRRKRVTIGGVAHHVGVQAIDPLVDDYLALLIEQRSRAMVGALVEGIATALWCFDATGFTQISNRAAKAMEPFLLARDEAGAARTIGGRAFADLVASPGPVTWDFSAPDHRRTFSLKTEVAPVEGSNRLVLVVTDVTHERATLHRLAEMERRVSIGILGAGVAHEINNPLAFVAANVTVLGEYLAELAALLPTHPQAQAIVADAPVLVAETAAGLERMRSIVKDLLAYSAVAGGDAEHPADASLAGLVDEGLRLFGRELRERCAIELTSFGEPRVRVQPRNFVDAVLDVVRNAVEAVSTHPPEARRVAVCVGEDGGRALLEVRDNGCGIPAEVLPRIFDPFFTTKGPGVGATGLGLSTALAIVRRQGGDMYVESREREGTMVRVILPAL